MTKNEFLRELENSLIWQLSKEDVSEVISDYSDIFENGLIEGKSETDIADELGSPAIISRTILEDSNNRYNSTVAKQTINKDTSNLATMSKRLGAYIIDAFSVALIFALLFGFITLINYMKPETDKYNVTLSVIKSNRSVDTLGNNFYKEITSKKNGDIKKIEFYLMEKRIFEGSEEEYNKFLKNRYENSENVTVIESVKNEPYEPYHSINQPTNSIIRPFPSSILMFLIPLIMLSVFTSIFVAIELWILNGYTLGKWLLKVKVQRQDGKRITIWDAILREVLIKSIGNSSTSGILNIVSFIWGCATPEHKTVQDLATNTKVISLER